jgi:hypothetical protein
MTSPWPNGSPGPQRFTAATSAKPAGRMLKAAKATSASSNDPYGLGRFERSRAQTPKGFKRLANAIARDAIGSPQTRKQRAEQRPPKLDSKEIDKNSSRAPVTRQRSPREMKSRRKPGWIDCRFVLPRVSLEGLIHLAKTMADQERCDRSSAPRGMRRRYPRTKNFYVIEALNCLFERCEMPEFCVKEAKLMSRRVRRFVTPT